MIKTINLMAQQTDIYKIKNNGLIQQFATQSKIINTYIILIIILYILLIRIQFYKIYSDGNKDMFILWLIIIIFSLWIRILVLLLILVLTWMIIRHKNTSQYAMYTNKTVNIIYHILYIAIIISIFTDLFDDQHYIFYLFTTGNFNIDKFPAIFPIPLTIKLILDAVIYYIYNDDYNNEIKKQNNTNNLKNIDNNNNNNINLVI